MKVAGIDRVKRVGKTYGLLRKLHSINGPDAKDELLDRMFYTTQELPPLGKEYWWFLFFGRSGKKPVQLMLLIFRKYGQKMLFDGKEMFIKGLTEKRFCAVTAGWVYDGKKLRDLGDTNAIVELQGSKILSEIAGERLAISGHFPNYKIKLGDSLDLKIKKGDFQEDRYAYGFFVPPFGMGWVDIFLEANGTVLGKKFNGPAYLQKVFGVSPFGPFNWSRIIFKDDSVATFFCVKTGKKAKRNIAWYFVFYDKKRNEIIRFHRPKIKLSKKRGLWVIEGRDKDKTCRIVLKTYAKKQFVMRGGGKQVYVEYAVLPKEFILKTKERTVTLKELGKGVGTLEDAYW